MRLQGKTAIITGASRGIGAAIAELFAREGAAVMLTARGSEVVELASRLRETGAQAEALAGDITDDAHIRALVQLFRAKFGSLDVLVNNAGVLIQAKLGMMRLDDARNMFAVNVLAAMNLTQYAIRAFRRGQGGAVINLASIAGTHGIDGISAYSASKAALIGFTKAAAKELAGQNIRVNAIAPGFIDTKMARQLSPEWFQLRVAGIRLGRIGRPEDIANCALFLASDEAAYITGQVLGADGGMQV